MLKPAVTAEMLLPALLLLPTALAVARRLSGTGGGLALPGSNLTLALAVGERWDRCRWFHNDASCSIDLDWETNTSSIHRCNSALLQEMIFPVSTDPGACSIQLVNLTSAMLGVWAARLDTDRDTEQLTVEFATPPTALNLSMAGAAMLGQNLNLTCQAEGGNPEPELSLLLADDAGGCSAGTGERFTVLESGAGRLVGVLVPELADHNRTICCLAVQTDRTNTSLLYTTSQELQPLDVLFPPGRGGWGGQAGTAAAKLGNQATLSLIFTANPAPEVVVWSVDLTGGCREDDSSNLTALPLCRTEIRPDQQFSSNYNVSRPSLVSSINHNKTDLVFVDKTPILTDANIWDRLGKESTSLRPNCTLAA